MVSLFHGSTANKSSVEITSVEVSTLNSYGLLTLTEEVYQNLTMDNHVCLNCTSTHSRKFDVFKKNQTVVNSSIMFAAGLLGNLLALFVLARSPASQRRTIFYRLVAGLVVTDVMGTATTSPVVIAVYINDFKWIGGDALCQYFAFMMEFAGATTVFIICTMSVERFVCIGHPYFYYSRLSPGHALYVLVGVWGLGLFLAILPLMGVGRNTLQYPRTWCFFDYYSPRLQDKLYCYLFGILGVVAVIITFVCNVIVMYILINGGWKHKLLNKSNSAIRTSRRCRYTELEMLVLLSVFTLTFFICWAPLVVRVIINQTGLLPRDDSIDLLMIRLASINQILDPWVYILMKRGLLWRIISFVKAIFCARSNKLQSSDHGADVIRRERDFYRTGEEPSCLATCLGCLCDPPENKTIVRNFSPSQIRRNHLYNSSGSLKLELTALRHVHVPNGNSASVICEN